MVCGVGHERLLHSRDRAEIVVENALVERAAARREQIRESEINDMANEIAKRFG